MSFIVGSFFGVVSGFAAERIYTWYRNRLNRKELKEILRDELDRCLKRLNGEGSILPTTMWNSTIATSDLRLLSFSQRTKLAMIYFDIENYNYEVKRVEDNEIIAQTGSGRTIKNGMEAPKASWIRLKNKLTERKEKIKQKLNELMKEPWLRRA